MVEIFNDAGIADDTASSTPASPTDVVVIDCLMLAALRRPGPKG